MVCRGTASAERRGDRYRWHAPACGDGDGKGQFQRRVDRHGRKIHHHCCGIRRTGRRLHGICTPRNKGGQADRNQLHPGRRQERTRGRGCNRIRHREENRPYRFGGERKDGRCQEHPGPLHRQRPSGQDCRRRLHVNRRRSGFDHHYPNPRNPFHLRFE